MATNLQKHPLGKRPAVAVTIAGENRGASMQLGSELAKKGRDSSYLPGLRWRKKLPVKEVKRFKNWRRPGIKSYVNSNVQGLKPLTFNSSITERDPGVELALS
ncbi:hypothetical protein Vadar_014807 [Vaccinium darrowii]|uniref:Uncharacterized protein n=1 Tax=Vaccinium darrowii TaxID=229202 RepID=A0ACB7Z4L6_9ERIC|nr:hypothetical protein Vadar_014807 [Vaccinium darrowii]